ncbi:DUF2029 domain-containing protein [Roseibium sp. CAU 1637]|uniref:DUF2029 domain-containing protein n=1 Tax=Roseibium limicola TaxID=2816037 RepID=A0A939J7E2_9HYPH|nr:glycosyltransferase family 87 protein [Roseibium limicola]MBO0343719.1 DUF2029 domain-containing protein [Roseibium limicola]
MNEKRQEGFVARFYRSEIAKAVAAFVIVIYMGRLGWDIANMFIGDGKPFFADFISFWTAAHSAVGGDPVLPYHYEDFSARQKELMVWHKFAFFYPPTWLLYILPLGFLPYMAAVLVFVILSVGLACWALAGLAQSSSVAFFALLWPGLSFGVLHGQNAMLNVALFGGCIAALERRQEILAGVLIGLMAYKPHLGVLVPVAFLAGGYWKAFAAAAATTVAVALLSALVFGLETWQAFLDQVPFANTWLVDAMVPMSKFASLFGLLRQFDVPLGVASGLQALVSILVFVTVAWIWRGALPVAIKGAVLVSAACLATPFILDYDLALLAIPVVLLMRLGWPGGFLRIEAEMLLLAFIAMFFTSGWGLRLDHSAAFLPNVLVFAACIRRAIQTNSGIKTELPSPQL